MTKIILHVHWNILSQKWLYHQSIRPVIFLYSRSMINFSRKGFKINDLQTCFIFTFFRIYWWLDSIMESRMFSKSENKSTTLNFQKYFGKIEIGSYEVNAAFFAKIIMWKSAIHSLTIFIQFILTIYFTDDFLLPLNDSNCPDGDPFLSKRCLPWASRRAKNYLNFTVS